MDKRILYKQDNGLVAVITPVDCGLTIHQLASRAVPLGKPYKIVNVSVIPTDRTQRDQWTIDDALLTDGIGGQQ